MSAAAAKAAASSLAASLGFGSTRRRRPRPGSEEEQEEEERKRASSSQHLEERGERGAEGATEEGGGGNEGNGSAGGPASKRRRRGSLGGGGARRFDDVKRDILSSKGLVRRGQEEALLRASRSRSGKWQRLTEAAAVGGGTLASLGLIARRSTGASTTFVALSTLALSYLFRGTLKRQGEEAERRLGQLKALEDDPGRVSRLLDLLDRDPADFFQAEEALALLERPRGELVVFREGHLVEEALLGKIAALGSTAFLRQPHLAAICARLRRDYPRLAEGMDAALLLELGDDYSPRAPGLADLVQVLVSWQWSELMEGNEAARRQLDESLRRALRVPHGSGPKGDLGEALRRIDAVLDERGLSLLKARLPRAYAEYCQGERLLLQAARGWKGGLSPFLARIPPSVLLRRLKPSSPTATYAYATAFRSPYKKTTSIDEPPLELLDALRLLLRREVAWAVERMQARTPQSARSSPVPSPVGAKSGAVTAVGPAARRGAAAKALDDLFEGQGWAFAAAHPALQLLLGLNPLPINTTTTITTSVPPAALLEKVAARREVLTRAAQADVERAERAAAARVAAAAGKAEEEMARLDALLARGAQEEAAALVPLLRQKDRVWAAINGRAASPIPETAATTTTLEDKMAALDAARAAIHGVQDAAAARRAELQAQREAARVKGEREARAAQEMGAARAAATEAALRSGKEALAREILAAVGWKK